MTITMALALAGIIFDVPVPPWEERLLTESLDFLEKVRAR